MGIGTLEIGAATERSSHAVGRSLCSLACACKSAAGLQAVTPFGAPVARRRYSCGLARCKHTTLRTTSLAVSQCLLARCTMLSVASAPLVVTLLAALLAVVGQASALPRVQFPAPPFNAVAVQNEKFVDVSLDQYKGAFAARVRRQAAARHALTVFVCA